MHAKGEIGVGERFVHESLIGTRFTGTILEEGRIGSTPTVIVSITGRAWITAFHQYVLDPTDPFPTGYKLTDTWPANE